VIGIVTGTGLYDLPLEDVGQRLVPTPFGACEITVGVLGETEVAHYSRHGAGHSRLSNHLEPRSAFAAFRALDVNAVVSTTVTGAVDRGLGLGSLVVFDDLYFPSNRLADGSLCTLFSDEGTADRGHWIFERPYSESVRSALLLGAPEAHEMITDGGVYGHVDGPRLNSVPEIAAMAAAGVAAISQTCAPETVLAGEAELPFAVLGFVTDYANGVVDEPTPPELLGRMLAESGPAFAAVLAASAPALDAEHGAAGFVYRLG
jgi:purine nucleoside phosphorylase